MYFRTETGTARNTGSVSDDGIDYDWLPQSTINELSKETIYNLAVLGNNLDYNFCIDKSPKGSPRRSPRLRKTKAGSSSD